MLEEIYNTLTIIREYIEYGIYGYIGNTNQRISIRKYERYINKLPEYQKILYIAYIIFMENIFYEGNKRTAFLLIKTYYEIDDDILLNIIQNSITNNYTKETFIVEVCKYVQ